MNERVRYIFVNTTLYINYTIQKIVIIDCLFSCSTAKISRTLTVRRDVE